MQELIELLVAGGDPAAQIRNWGLASGGCWDDDCHAGLFEVQYLAVAGIGVAPAVAVRDWIGKAALQFQDHTWASALNNPAT